MSANWRMPEMCDNCPFAKGGAGAALAKSLRRGRMAEIKRGLLQGNAFYCHKTTAECDEDDEEGYVSPRGGLLCAGALDWQNSHGASSNLQRVMEALDYFASRREQKV